MRAQGTVMQDLIGRIQQPATSLQTTEGTCGCCKPASGLAGSFVLGSTSTATWTQPQREPNSI
eukprot:1144598-Pelagomonas_calceolata.AAC.5